MASQGQCAKHLGISRRQFIDLLDAGHVTRRPENGYDLGEVVRQVVKHYKGRGANEVDEQRARLARTQADKNEIEIAEKKRRLIPMQWFVDAWMRLASMFRTNAMSIPRAKAHLFVGLKDIAKAEQQLAGVVDELLRDISQSDPRVVLGLDRKRVRSHKTAAANEGVGVG